VVSDPTRKKQNYRSGQLNPTDGTQLPPMVERLELERDDCREEKIYKGDSYLGGIQLGIVDDGFSEAQC
jgi:hypothetical protein